MNQNQLFWHTPLNPWLFPRCSWRSAATPDLPLIWPFVLTNGLQIRYHEAFLLGNKLCTVMEFAPFGDLKYYITKGAKLRTPFPEEAIWRILLQLCK